mmetsp:Transcript_23423/g.35352  ORF Transcript_23423/g.35352 Transcript_23423/m.35352 type:complete len:187 (+) Transcript_23423:67-627(+)
MAPAVLKLFGIAAAFALVSAEQAIPDDESCDVNDEECALSLRQLRGELQAAEVAQHQEFAMTAEAGEMFEKMMTDFEASLEGKAESQSESESQGACYGNWRSGFSYKMKTCAMANGGQAAGTTSCLTERFGYKYGCAKCMGDMVTCGFQCLSECCTGQCTESGPCKACNKAKCAPGFTRCAGVAPP